MDAMGYTVFYYGTEQKQLVQKCETRDYNSRFMAHKLRFIPDLKNNVYV